jgi:hypothetical protein
MQGNMMKKTLFIAVASLSLGTSVIALADKIHDWEDLDKVHSHVLEAIREMEHASAANHYDMDGHGKKAEQLLRDAEKELHSAVESAKHAH